MPHKINIEEHFLEPPYNIVETIAEYGDQQDRSTSVKADVTNWTIHHHDTTFDKFIHKFHGLYPKHQIKELWGVSYSMGDYAETHTHSGFDLSFAWFVDSCPLCTPLVFPNTRKLWMPPVATYTPEVGTLLVFSGQDNHYVPPHTCRHKRVVISGNAQLINTEATANDPWHQ